jgi:hypothetical protein
MPALWVNFSKRARNAGVIVDMTNNSALIVHSQPAAPAPAAAPKFQDSIKPLIDIPNVWLWIIGIAVGLLLLGLAWLLWKYWKKRSARLRMAPPVPPHVQARRMLDHALTLISEPKPFTIAVSGAIRIYLEQRFEFHAPDRTTEEFLYELQASPSLTGEQKESLAGFLASCDLIKFSQYEPTEVELHGLHAAALRLVDETEPRPTPLNTASVSQ